MQTGTINHKQYTLTIILLCVGYFIDFYDLTIFSASYTNIIQGLFNIYDPTAIQLLYLKITNYNTAGIIIGGLFFGILGDKLGRTTIIRYSILLYSIAIIASCFTTSITLFSILRFLAGAGLAAEFATSSVLISEMLPRDIAAKSTAWLYFCGILGGMTATFLSMISWKVMFLCGGGGGLALFVVRKNLFESPLFLHLPPHISKGNPWRMFSNRVNLLKTLRLTALILPFYFLISVMFILPNFMQINSDLSDLIHTLLIGFFTGNLISTLLYNYYVVKVEDFQKFFVLNSMLFLIILISFSLINQVWFFTYTLALGILGGGLPSIWIQVVAKSYGTNQRNTAANTLYIIGRGSGIGFNLLIASWLTNANNFNYYCIITTIIIATLSIVASIGMNNVYKVNTDYLDPV
ncbi:MAG: hypothetical protein QG673_2053 [Pseudomonadota bacterium]|nr:hypothetical protein [Pseudomonadota bacterium]